jgi:hypothetical protein
MSDRPRPRYRIDLEALPAESGLPPEIRLRAILKIALRGFRLKCLRVEELLGKEESDGTQAGQTETKAL